MVHVVADIRLHGAAMLAVGTFLAGCSIAPAPSATTAEAATVARPVLRLPHAEVGNVTVQQNVDSVAVSDSGDRVAVGAPTWVTGQGVSGDELRRARTDRDVTGGLWVIDPDANDWVGLAPPTAAASHESLGRQTALSGDGSTLAVSDGDANAVHVLFAGQWQTIAAPALHWASTEMSPGLAAAVPVDPPARESLAACQAACRDTADVCAERCRDLASFGDALALSLDGRTLVVAARSRSVGYDPSFGVPTDGAVRRDLFALGFVYVYQRDDRGLYALATTLSPPEAFHEGFGAAVSISGDGAWVAVGDLGRSEEEWVRVGADGAASENRYRSGAIHLYARSSPDGASFGYLLHQTIAPPEGQADGYGGFYGTKAFGALLALSASGDRLAVGRPTDRFLAVPGAAPVPVTAPEAGGLFDVATVVHVTGLYVYDRLDGSLALTAAPTLSNVDNGPAAIAISADGSTVALGDNLDRPCASVLGGPAGVWIARAPFEGFGERITDPDAHPYPLDGASEQGVLMDFCGTDEEGKPVYLDPRHYRAFGRAVALDGNGTTLAVGAAGFDSAAYVFAL